MTKFAGEHLDIWVAVTLNSWGRWAVKHAMRQPNQALMPDTYKRDAVSLGARRVSSASDGLDHILTVSGGGARWERQ